MKKIIHIVSDEKFINSAYWQFNETFPNGNKFYLLVDDPKKDLKFIEHKENYILIKKDLKELQDLAQNKALENIVCFHGLDYHKSYLLNKLSSKATIIWFLWGAEVYSNSKIVNQAELYGFHTRTTFLSISFLKILKNRFRQFYYKLKYKTDGPDKLILHSIKRANFCAVLYKEEYEFIKERITTNLQYLKFSYYPIQLMIGNTEARISSSNILIGNSASDTNNHIEAFKLLKDLPIGDKKIIVPLSYGEPRYRDRIVIKGLKILKDNFYPLMDFMPLHHYNQFLEQCGIVVMNHYRQQAVGNVVTMLWMGAKVYLDERNTLFAYLKRIGVTVHSIEKELRADNPQVFSLLTYAEQENNRQILSSEVGQDYLLQKLKYQFEEINI